MISFLIHNGAKVVVDSDGAVAESDEDNNAYLHAVTVIAAD